MHISICQILDKRLKEAVALNHGYTVGLHWPTSVVEPLEERIEALNQGGFDEGEVRLQVVDLRGAVIDHFPHLEAQDAAQEEGAE